ncbi:hypothetical protein IMF22_04360 [Pseudomonas poae]|uniref:Uncharacterized protein n=1 Tax=Pseudomonas poae TaxID=200451 RepID=A0A7M1KIX4_9PSED|nr:hypothetical protein [Pseudomonas poae]QOQ76316.1 hypothetical protein IMF22_04360 [Pseudomonas poae]
MSSSIIDHVLLVIGIADIVGLMVWIGVCLHLAYTKMDVMLEHLKNSPAITAWAPMRQGGPWGKLLLIGGISGLVTFPGPQLKTGQLNAEDLANFPVDLKRKLIRLYWGVIGLLLIMVTFGLAIQLGWF